MGRAEPSHTKALRQKGIWDENRAAEIGAEKPESGGTAAAGTERARGDDLAF